MLLPMECPTYIVTITRQGIACIGIAREILLSSIDVDYQQLPTKLPSRLVHLVMSEVKVKTQAERRVEMEVKVR